MREGTDVRRDDPGGDHDPRARPAAPAPRRPQRADPRHPLGPQSPAESARPGHRLAAPNRHAGADGSADRPPIGPGAASGARRPGAPTRTARRSAAAGAARVAAATAASPAPDRRRRQRPRRCRRRPRRGRRRRRRPRRTIADDRLDDRRGRRAGRRAGLHRRRCRPWPDRRRHRRGALEEAGHQPHAPARGIGDSRPAAPKPQIGDSAPGLTAATAARRQRRGRDRRRDRRAGRAQAAPAPRWPRPAGAGGAGGDGGGTAASTAPGGGGGGRSRAAAAPCVTTSCGPTSASVRRPLADARRRDARAAPRPHPQGAAGRPLPDVRARRWKAATRTSRCSRAAAWSSTTLATPDRQRVDRRQHLPRPGAERAARHGGRVHRHRHAQERRALPRRRRVRQADVEGGSKPKIERVLRNGQSIIVQVTKNPIAHKGARLTQEVSLAGRFVVMVPGQPETYGISKRLPDDERKRLRKVLDGIRPTDAGLIVRTAAEGATEDELERDMRRLRNQWQQISALAGEVEAGASSSTRSPTSCSGCIREEFTKEYRGVVIDDRALYEEVRGYVEAIAPELADRVEFYDAEAEGLPIFERFHVSRAAAQGARPQGVAAVGRLAHHRAHRGAHRHRRQHRQERREVEPRGDRLPQQPRGGRGGRPPAAAARHRRHHRHRLHRHGDQGRTATR